MVDLEDRVGWGVIPVAMLLAFTLNVARHLLVVLLVPDKRARRTAAAALSVAAYYLSFGSMRFNSTLPICTLTGRFVSAGPRATKAPRGRSICPARTSRSKVSERPWNCSSV